MAMTFVETDAAAVCTVATVTCEAGVIDGIAEPCTAEVGGSAGTGTFLVNALSSSIAAKSSSSLITCSIPASTTGDAGTWTVQINITTANMNLTWAECWVCRVNSLCVN